MSIDLIYRLLRPDEFDLLAPIYKPGPASVIAGAFDVDKLAAFFVLQAVLHSEPIYVAPEYRGHVSLGQLQRLLEDQLPSGTQYYAFCPSRDIASLLSTHGYESLSWRVWKKEVK